MPIDSAGLSRMSFGDPTPRCFGGGMPGCRAACSIERDDRGLCPSASDLSQISSPTGIGRRWHIGLHRATTSNAQGRPVTCEASPVGKPRGRRRGPVPARAHFACGRHSVTIDVVVVGGGNAALCAALSASDAGASVLVLERSDRWDRGGNSRHTRNLRCVRDGATPDTTYTEDELFADLRAVTGEGFDDDLARLTIARSREAPAWMEAHGARWQPALRGTLQLDRTNRFFLGGGKALVNAYYERAIAAGVDVRYRARVDRLRFQGDAVTSVVVGEADGPIQEIACRAVVVASGGFEANLEWLRRYWGDAVDNYRIRGTAYNDGHVLAGLLEAGALARGNERGFHAIAVDARAPRFDGGIVTRVDSIPFGIVVDRAGHRFYDEGEEIWPKRYASWGRLIAQQPGQIAYSIFDSKAHDRFIPCAYPPYTADSIDALVRALGLDGELARTVAEFNSVAHPGGAYDMSGRDGRATRGLAIPKSNWALALDAPPFYAYPLRPGITFTYLGVGVDAQARVLRASGGAFANLFAAGEVMSGNILRNGYLGGFGMTIGTVFGRIAGEGAASVRH